MKQLWRELKDKLSLLEDISVVLIGNFNSIFFSSERKNCEFRATNAKLFADFVEEGELVNTPVANSSFTCHGPANKKSRLDRALLNNKWAGTDDWITEALNRKNLDPY